MNKKKENQGKQPIYNESRLLNFIEDKKLEKDFYNYYVVKNEALFRCLSKSSFYISIETKYNNYIRSIENVEPPKEYLDAITDIVSK